LTYFIERGGIVDDSNNVDSDNVYRGRVKPVLVLLSDSYSEDKISVGDSRYHK